MHGTRYSFVTYSRPVPPRSATPRTRAAPPIDWPVLQICDEMALTSARRTLSETHRRPGPSSRKAGPLAALRTINIGASR